MNFYYFFKLIFKEAHTALNTPVSFSQYCLIPDLQGHTELKKISSGWPQDGSVLSISTVIHSQACSAIEMSWGIWNTCIGLVGMT